MSVQALAWVFDHSPTTGSDRLVLLALANHAGKAPVDGAWEAWPGIDTICREAGIRREGTVKDALQRLVAGGHVDRVVNGAPDTRIRADRRPNLYRLRVDVGGTVDVPPSDDHGGTDDGATGGRFTASRGDGSRSHGGTDTAPRTKEMNRREEPKGEPRALELVADDPRRDPAYRFDDFWHAYPKRNGKRVGRAKTLERWKALGYDDKAAAFRGVRHYAAHCDAGLTLAKDPERWLRDRLWSDWQDAADPARAPLTNRERRFAAHGTTPRLLEALGYAGPDDDGPRQLGAGT